MSFADELGLDGPAASAAPPTGAQTQSAPAPAPTGDGGERSLVGRIASEIGTGITEIIPGVGAGIVKGLNEVSTAWDEAGDAIASRLGDLRYGPDGFRWISGEEWAKGNVKNPAQIPASMQPPEPTTIIGGASSGISQFLTGYILGGKILKGASFTAARLGSAPGALLTGGAVGTQTAANAVSGTVAALNTTAGKLALAGSKSMFSGAVAFDPAEKRLSNLINEETPFGFAATEWLAASPEDSQAEGRLKNALENLILDVPFEAAFYALKGIKAARAGKMKEAEEFADEAEKVVHRDAAGLTHAPPSEADTAYHGSRAEFSAFDLSKSKSGTGLNFEGHGVYLTRNEQEAGLWSVEKHDLDMAPGNNVAAPTEGNLYTVKMKFNPEEALRWDETIDKQPDNVKAAITKLFPDGVPDGVVLGEDVYGVLAERLGGPEAASKALNEAGVPAHNFMVDGFVVYDAANATITQRRKVRGDLVGTPRQPKSDYDPTPVTVTKAADGTETVAPWVPSFKLDEGFTERLFDRYGKVADDPAKMDAAAKKHLWQNMSLIKDENDAKAFANTLGEMSYMSFAKAKGTRVTEADVRVWAAKMADEISDWTGRDVTETVMMMNRDRVGLEELVKRMAGYQSMEALYRRRATDFASAWRRGDFSEFGGDKQAFMREALSSVYTYHSIAPETSGIRTGLGRNLALLKAGHGVEGEVKSLPGMAATGPSAEAKAASRQATPAGMVAKAEDDAMRAAFDEALAGGEPQFNALMERLARVDSAKGARKVIDRTFQKGGLDVNNELWINALLSGPKTHIINVMSSAIKSALVMPGEQMMAGVLARDKDMFMMGADQYWGFARAMKDAVILAGRSFKFGDAILDRGSQGLGETQHAIVPSTFGLNAETPLGALVSGFGTLVRMPGRLLTTEDELLKQLNYRARLHALAMREVRDLKRTKNVSEEDLAKAYNSHFEQGFDANGAATNAEALSWARDATYTNALKVETWSGRKSIGEELNTFAVNHPGMRMIMPFTRVPTNILRDAWDHTPGMNYLRKQYRAELDAGGERRAMALAKMATGGSLWLGALTMAISGDIVGALSSDPVVRRTQEEAKIVPNSLRRVDPETGEVTYIQFSRLEPYGTFFSAVATFADIARDADDYQMEDLAGSFVAATAKLIESKTYLQGLTEVMGALADPERRGTTFLERRIASYVPSLTNSFRDADHLSDPTNLAERMKARTSRANEVAPRFNLLGERVALPEAFGPDHLSPIAIGKPDDPALLQLARLSLKHDGGLGYPAKKHNASGLDLTQLPVSGSPSAYARWQELSGQVQVGGRTLRGALEELFNSDLYNKQLTDGNARDDGSRITRVQSTIEMFRQAGFGQLLKENPELRAQVEAAEQAKIDVQRFGVQK